MAAHAEPLLRHIHRLVCRPNTDPAGDAALLERLPEVYRLPLILCGLEGRPQQEAARLLGWISRFTPPGHTGAVSRWFYLWN